MLTQSEIAELLRQAESAVDDAALAEDLRTIGFERALDELGLGTMQGAPAPSAMDGRRPTAIDSDPAAPTAGLLIEIARLFELPLDSIERIYEVDDGQVRLAIKRSMLPDTRKAAAMRDVSLLVATGRQAAGEEETALAAMREECSALGVLDSANFSAEIGKLGFRLQGTRNTKTARANRHHREEAVRLVMRVLGEPQS
jgi:hypothetical protein